MYSHNTGAWHDQRLLPSMPSWNPPSWQFPNNNNNKSHALGPENYGMQSGPTIEDYAHAIATMRQNFFPDPSVSWPIQWPQHSHPVEQYHNHQAPAYQPQMPQVPTPPRAPVAFPQQMAPVNNHNNSSNNNYYNNNNNHYSAPVSQGYTWQNHSPSSGSTNSSLWSGSSSQHQPASTNASSTSLQSHFSAHMQASPRGPPLKPKKSGHALWVGNLPLGASIEALKDHFARGATYDIESVALLRASNCGFVNYRTLEACEDALERFNLEWFGSVRLLCRLRLERAESEERTAERQDSVFDSSEQTVDDVVIVNSNPTPVEPVEDHSTGTRCSSMSDSNRRRSDRYFIVKSLTLQDLQASLTAGTWETQPHNRATFDEAYASAENVYLIFSINKSGEYFGYAKMCSASYASVSTAPRSSNTTLPYQEVSGVRTTPTPATNTAPAGYIVEDAARGTLFWEVGSIIETKEQQQSKSVTSSFTTDDGSINTPSLSSSASTHSDERMDGMPVSTPSSSPRPTSPSASRLSTHPFKVTWLSIRSVPFQRVKGLRNPWNDNKEVKVARDGTELETSVGRRVIEMFHNGDKA